jgi:anti-sigma regulatory factor (Ser/Thr protein kinase)
MVAQLGLELPRTPESPGISRRWLDERFAAQLDDSELATAKLLISELVTNAVVHGRGRIGVRGWSEGDHVHVEVTDEGTRFVRGIRTPCVGGRGGLGLAILDAEATRWGIGEDATTRVWFDLQRSAATEAARSTEIQPACRELPDLD